MEQEWVWTKALREELAAFINVEAIQWVSVPNRYDLVLQDDGRRRLVEALYDTLRLKGISYAREKYNYSEKRQRIRPPFEVFDDPKEGTCLDLALVFCSLCLGFDLLPIIIVTEGHAFAAVSLTHGLDQFNAKTRKEKYEFEKILTTPKVLLDLIDTKKNYIAIECTGFASSLSLPANCPEGRDRSPDGLLTFQHAVDAGREQFEFVDQRPFAFALDVAMAQNSWEIPVKPLPPWRGIRFGLGQFQPKHAGKHLSCLSDRTRQAEQLLAELDRIGQDIEPRPLVCVLDGDEDQGHECFIDRLESYDLPRWLPRQVERGSVLRAFVPLPTRFRRASQFEDELWLGLADAVVPGPDFILSRGMWGGPPSATPLSPRDAARKVLSEHPGPILISTDFCSEDWSPDGPRKIDGFLNFWSSFAPLTAEKRLIVCLCVKYDQRAPSRLVALLRLRDPNREIRYYLDRLRDQKFASWPSLRCVKPDRLESVSLQEVLELDEVGVIRAYCSGARLAPHLEALYFCQGPNAKSYRVPMHTIVIELKKILDRYHDEGGFR